MADKVKSIAVVPNATDNFDELWMVVSRENGEFIEKMSRRLIPVDHGSGYVIEPDDQIFMDAAVTYNSTATSTVTGVDHLEGLTVAIIADGASLTQQTVAAGADTITLPGTYSQIAIGLPYYSDLETLSVDFMLPDGTLQGRKAKIGNATVKFIRSFGGHIGPDSDNLYEAFTQTLVNRYVSSLDFDGYTTPPYLYTGDIRVPTGGSYASGGRVFFRQVDPMPVTISSIVPEVDIGGRSG